MSERDNERFRERYAADPEFRKRRRAHHKAWRRANKDKVNATRRLKWATDVRFREAQLKCRWKSRLKVVYGITLEEYDRMLAKQKGRCTICKTKPRGRVHVDHDHRKKFLRRLLCGPCNRGLGIFKDNSQLLREAGAYIDAEAKAYRAGKRPRMVPKKGGGGRKRKR